MPTYYTFSDSTSAQASAYIYPGEDSTGTQTILYIGGNINPDTVSYIVYANCTTVPSSSTKIDLYMSTSNDNTSWTDYSYVQPTHGFDPNIVPDDFGAADYLDIAIAAISNPSTYTKFKLRAGDYGVTASCVVENVYTTTLKTS